MTTARYGYNIYSDIEFFRFAAKRTGTISGTVLEDGTGNPLQRVVLVYKNMNPLLHASGASDPVTGAYSIPIVGTSADLFMVICLGENGEYSEILDRVVAVMD